MAMIVAADSKSQEYGMANEQRPPFRADHVGSLLRPRYLLEARAAHGRGDLTLAQLREVEDKAVREVVTLQEDLGFQGITDGEFRRTLWHMDFLRRIDGVAEVDSEFVTHFRRADGADVGFKPNQIAITKKLGRVRGIQTEDFAFLNSVVSKTAKVSIPSPSILHFRGGRDAIDRMAYPEIEAFFEDLGRVYNEEVMALADLGCRYLQIDDTNFAYLCDPIVRESVRRRGDDPDQLIGTYARLINAGIAGRPADMAVCVHMCRGNYRSAWAAEGGYEPIAEMLFAELAIDGFFMEFDDHRSGDFAPLRFLPRGKMAVLGLVTSKTPELESKDALKHRIDDAARYAPLDQLALSPQCGFSSSAEGNELTIDDQTAKLRLVVETAREVWG